MPEILFFIKDLELGTKLSSTCVDLGLQVEFSDENTDPDNFGEKVQMAIIDMDEKVFSSVGLISELKRRGLKVVGTMTKINNRDRSKLRSAGCDIIMTRSSILKNISNLVSEFII
tara:strand:+ start:118 stop:462 length:345 start_codon:yes stop_codon:yes gene_type:complete